MIYVLDTSAVLNGALKKYPFCYISPIVISELEKIKTSSNKDNQIKFLARQAVDRIISSNDIMWSIVSQKKIDKLLKQYCFLQDIPDHRLICEALIVMEEIDSNVVFVTSDGAQALFVKELPQLKLEFYRPDKPEEKEDYCGWGKYWPTAEQFETLYTSPEFNILNAKINEFCELFEGDELKDILIWNGDYYTKLKYKSIKNNFLNTTIHPLNLEQKMAFHLLQDETIPVKLLIGPPGTGKDILMILHALDAIQRGEKEKIIFIRNLIPFKDAPEIGFLSGSLSEKIQWGLGPISSLLGEAGLEQYQEQGIIEAMNLGFIRGCSWDNTIIYVSEGQNITGGGYKLLVSRCGKNSELWVNGDILQTDKKQFEENNGLNRLIDSLGGNKQFGVVKLLKTERSPVAELAAVI